MPKVIWKVDDGYVNNGPHVTTIDKNDLDECETEEERQQYIEECIHQDFENNVSWYITSITDD